MPLTFVFENSQIRWIMWRDNPRQAVMFAVAAAGCWLGYYLMGRRLRAEERP